MNTKEALQVFREVFPGSKVYETEAQAVRAMQAEKPCTPILCNYMGERRRVHPEVCKWHRERNDPLCSGCTPGTPERPSWDPYNLPPGEYVPDGKEGWRLKKRTGGG